MNTEFTIAGLDMVQKALASASKTWPPELQKAARKALEYLWSQVPEYPPKPQAGEASKHWTDKQRRWFFWNLRNAPGFEPVYKRTGTLGRTISVAKGGVAGALGEVVTMGDRIEIVFGTALTYAPDVIGSDQAPIHAGRWWKLEDVAKDALPQVTQILEDAVALWVHQGGLKQRW